ncbi:MULTISPECIES: CBS domain-containing protein [unclassified Acidisoma]|jgi:CBS domain-containing protein|uniref:CBS domain-containing protein n=1 Tax=unclassified Acidisoma TaxID=2634065 RepID=UPI0020B143DD|nr:MULTISPECIES: CBS domain-containing protein [unclassified Acidisoma]
MMTTVRHILDQKGWGSTVLGANQTIPQVAKFLTAKRIGAAPVVDDNGVVLGMLSERDIMRFVGELGEDTKNQVAANLMTTLIASCTPESSILDAMLLMTNKRCRHLPVFEDQALVGMVSIGDLVKARLEEAEFEVASMRAYITS